MKLLLTFGLLFQANPPYIPIWAGREPIQYCISGEMESYREQATFAFFQWASHTGLYARETRDCAAPRTVAYRMQLVEGHLGLAMYPPPLHAEPAAGDVWIDNRQDWGGGARPLLVPMLLHETGHAFGMGHSVRPDSVMEPTMRAERTALGAPDRWTIGCLYLGECK